MRLAIHTAAAVAFLVAALAACAGDQRRGWWEPSEFHLTYGIGRSDGELDRGMDPWPALENDASSWWLAAGLTWAIGQPAYRPRARPPEPWRDRYLGLLELEHQRTASLAQDGAQEQPAPDAGNEAPEAGGRETGAQGGSAEGAGEGSGEDEGGGGGIPPAVPIGAALAAAAALALAKREAVAVLAGAGVRLLRAAVGRIPGVPPPACPPSGEDPPEPSE